jgi:hypothetical protein
MAVVDTQPVVRLETFVAAYGMPGALLDPPSEPLPDADWSLTTSIVREQRLSGLLARAVADGVVPVTAAQRQDTLDMAAAAAAATVIVERTLLRAVDVVEAAGIDYRVLKGPSIAHTAYPDPAMREFGDVDLLFHPGDLMRAIDVFVAAGARRRNAELRPGFEARFGQGSTLVDPNGVELDLHRTFVDGPFGMNLDASLVFERTTTFDLGGRLLKALPAEERFVHICVHAALGSRKPRLVPVRDVAQLVLNDELDLPLVHRLALGLGLEAVVARAVRLAWTTFALADITALSRWASTFVPTPEEQRLLDLYVGNSASWGARAMQSARRLPGVRAKAAYLRAVAFPEDDALHELRRTRRRWFQRGLGLVFRNR